MKELLNKYGIHSFENVIYEYNSIPLNWWNKEEEIIFEVQISKNESGLELAIYFLFESEEEYERVVVFIAQTDADFENIIGANLVAKIVKEHLLEGVKGLEYVAEQEAYTISDMETSKHVFELIMEQLSDTNPTIAEESLNLDDEDEEGLFFETLALYAEDHATFSIEKYEATLKEQVKEFGADFLKYLKMEVSVIEDNELWRAFLEETPFQEDLHLTEEDLIKIAYLINKI